MCSSKNQCADNGKCAVRGNAPIIVRHECSDHQQGHTGEPGQQNARVPVMAKAKPQRNNAQRQYHDEHLRMQVTLGELRQERQTCNNQRQCQAVNEAQGRQAYCYAVEPFGRLRHNLIHREMPLS